MIDGHGQQSTAVGLGPSGGDMKQGQGVATPRQGQHDRLPTPRLESRGEAGLDSGHPGGIKARRQPGLRAGVAAAAGQPTRVRVTVARARTAGVAPGA